MSAAARAARLAAASLCLAGAARAEDAAALPEHRRLVAPEGVVHVWRPPQYRHADAGIVIYVHGYFAGADEVWTQHGLAEQFQRSGENALFIVPEAPLEPHEPVAWRSLDALLRAVRREQPLPKGPLVVVSHSGGFRTVLGWLGDRRLRQLILLDALYGRERPFHAWLRSGGKPQKRLVLVASETEHKAERFAAQYRQAARLPEVPQDASQLTPAQRSAPLVYMRSQYEHTEIVTSGRVIPLLLQLTALALR